MLTTRPLSCNIIQVAERYGQSKKPISLDWQGICRKLKRTWKKKEKTSWQAPLDAIRYKSRLKQTAFKWKFENNTSKDKVVLWKLNNTTWIICDSSQMFLKTSIDYEHKQSAISLLGFFLKLRPKRLLEPIKVLHILWRVWSWLRTNAGGVLNTCKSYETIESLLLKVEWQTGE